MSLRLPEHPNLDVLRRQAKAVLRLGHLVHDVWRLSDAQRALARGYGRSNWSDLKESVKAEGRRTFAVQRAAKCVDDRGRAESSAPAASSRLTGAWVSRDPATARVALDITESAHAFWLTQVDMAAAGGPVAGCLLLRVDGQEHVADVTSGEALRIRTSWTDERTLRTVVKRDGVTVSEGTYALSSDGATLTLVGAAGQMVFQRAASRPPRGAGVRRAGGAVLAAVALACGGCATISTTGGTRPRTDTQADDRRAIEALNRHDISAALTSDIDAVTAQWTEDFVVLPPAGPIMRGRAANRALMDKARPQLERFEPTAYTVDFEEIVVTGDYAFAWGLFRAVVRPRAGGPDIVSTGKLLRVYQRQPDGRWLMHRTISTMDARTPSTSQSGPTRQ